VIPGPPISFIGILLLWAARDWHAETFGLVAIVVMGAAAILVSIIDNVAPAMGAKKYGASRTGFWMSVLGMLIGMIWFPPFGLILGALGGALAGEFLVGKSEKEALRAAWGVFVGTMLGIVLKFVVSIANTVYFVAELV
jgi:uncharacterized protein YqgC (DUF456 family)